MNLRSLPQAIEEVLACPACKSHLSREDGGLTLKCCACRQSFPVFEGIPILLIGKTAAQEEERQWRDRLAAQHGKQDVAALMETIGRHHCIPLMRQRAAEFHQRFKADQWILDIGPGWGWHWANLAPGARVLGVDMSLHSLLIAQRLLRPGDPVVLVCADAANLPIRAGTISGGWSVQVFQHFPPEILRRVQDELERVLKDDFEMEIYNLNLPWLHRLIYPLFGKRLHRTGKEGEMMFNRYPAREWTAIWRKFRNGAPIITHRYSELFFHPEFHLRPDRYPLGLEDFLATRAPGLAALFARQLGLHLEAGR